MYSVPEAAVLRTLAWFMTVGYPPLEAELWADLCVEKDGHSVSKAEVQAALLHFVEARAIMLQHGRYALPGHEFLFAERRRRERFFVRKWRKIQRLRWVLRWCPTIRFLAVCNTTALGAARDEADIDFFVIVKTGSLWLTRGFLTLVTALLRQRPGQAQGERDAICFSFFIDDTNLDLERFALMPDDPYLRFWLRHLVPLLDDGVGEALWLAQTSFQSRHPQARRWIAWQRLPARDRSLPKLFHGLERWALRVQKRFGSRALWEANIPTQTNVVLDEHICKAHVEDRRRLFLQTYEALCDCLDIAP